MFALFTDCNQIKQDNVVEIHDSVDCYGNQRGSGIT
jgi:hypothetical protein